MLADIERPTNVIKSENSSKAAESWVCALADESRYVVCGWLLVATKFIFGCNGKLVWRHTPWLGPHAAKGPVRPLRRALQNGPTETNAALEFAVNSLEVENILVIGHSCCGGIRALMGMQDDVNSRFGQFQSFLFFISLLLLHKRK
ncbi:hypothetical protein LOK49_LG06G01024 [Camellia lanceoleosa]|uniref:Uncharacterized protein n=1 Tax=Camellia lanceoleosa TaxID=1840588 RepID=A0ACC0HEI6_9ERIC|nr:hypothetical protein LOK49_LG06G01024 [Camellia lanceoleosa]